MLTEQAAPQVPCKNRLGRVPGLLNKEGVIALAATAARAFARKQSWLKASARRLRDVKTQVRLLAFGDIIDYA